MKSDTDHVAPSRATDRRGRIVLGPRDAALLRDVALLRALRRSQIQSLHFSSVPRCNFRLRQLTEAGFLVRAYPPAATPNGEALYRLGRAGVAVVTDALQADGWDVDVAEMDRHRRRALPLFLTHALAVADCYVCLRHALGARPDWRLERWVPEPWCHDEYRVRVRRPESGGAPGAWRQVAFKPDGFFRLSRVDGGGQVDAFLEADMGHASAQRMAYKLRIHQDYRHLGLFRAVYGAGDFRTLVVTTDAVRLARLEGVAVDTAGARVWLTTIGALKGDGMLGDVWRVAGVPGLRGLVGRGERDGRAA